MSRVASLRSALPVALSLAILLAGPPPAAAAAVSCPTAVQDARAAGEDLDALAGLYAGVERSCDADTSRAVGTLLGRAEFRAYQKATADGARQAHLERAILHLQDARWQAHAALGELFQKRSDYGAASKQYQLALVHLQDNPHVRPPADAVTWLLSRANAARALAPDYAPVQRSRSGNAGGVAARTVGGVVVDAVPFPVEFDFDSADLTGTAPAVIDDMFDIISQSGLTEITLAGHTDPEGSDAYNMDLSLRRAETVGRALLDRGLQVRIMVRAAGEREPPELDDPTLYTREQADAIARRVEVEWR